jgi:cytoskeleton protein RodZ
MSDETENLDGEAEAADAEAAEAEGPRCGERLAEARRELQISVHEIAKELHLDEPKVRALERNEFDVLGAPVFAKGHLKTYAHLVNVNHDDVLIDYYRITRATAVPPVISARPRPKKELSPGPWIGVIVVIIVLVTAFWWFTRPPTETEPEVQFEEFQPAEVPQDESEAPPASSDNSAEILEQTAPQVVEPVVEEESQPEPQTEPVVEAGQLHVLVTYTGDCWTEITDANGRRLLFDLGKDGRTVELSGAEPLNVLFGNPGNVSLRVNGKERALPPTNRPDRPMRLTLSGT